MSIERPQDYVAQAKLTESIVGPAAMKHLPELVAAFDVLKRLGVTVDAVKVSTFYGKSVDLPPLPDSIPVSNYTETAAISGTGVTANMRFLHGVLGIVTEAIELVEALMRPQHSRTEIMGELGDLQWYCAIAGDAMGFDYSDVWTANIAKLRRVK